MLHGNKQAIFLQDMEISGSLKETFCMVTMQPQLFELKLKTIPLLQRRDHFVFKRKILK